MRKLIFVYITNPDMKTAKMIAKKLLENKLIACANLYNIESMYWWEDKISEEPEVVLIGKTTADKYNKIKLLVETLHPYSVPCIIQLSVEGSNDPYRKWILDETQISS